ncbi:MAG: serine--tRNA ligase [Calditrichales bacterium]|nr:MAG: serine--tRNA ligase [Calditrichales bacterium]
MLDIKFIRENPDLVINGTRLKNEKCDVAHLIDLDSERRKIIFKVEQLKKERNDNSQNVALLKKEKKDATALIERTREISDEIKKLDAQISDLELKVRFELDRIPNLPHASAPVGKSSEDNVEIKTWGKIPAYDFEVKDHLALGENLDILDFKRGGKISGSGFPVYKGMGARLERALINFMLDVHINEHGYTEIFPPFMVNRASMYGTGQLPKMAEDMYFAEKDDLFLIPTAEVPVTNMHRDEIIPVEQLPVKYVAYSACFRREAGSYGKDTKGFLRVHQFNKVEMVNFTLPEESYAAHERLLKEATHILELLEVPYRVLSLATGDLSFAAAKCYDIETWSPAEQKWLEASSVSNFEDFQARRANIRFRPEKDKPLSFVHTLNGSGLATSRLMVSLLEINQTDEGTITIPPVLRPYLNGIDVIKKDYK